MKSNKSIIIICLIAISITGFAIYHDKLVSREKPSQIVPNYNLHGINDSSSQLRTIFATNFLAPQLADQYSQWQQLPMNTFGTPSTGNSYPKKTITLPITYNLNFDMNNNYTNSLGDTDDANKESSPILQIDDLDYNESNTAESEPQEIIFVTDYQQNQLISCSKGVADYRCHVAVSNLNNPQDILILGNYIYIINSHATGKIGDITRCQINNQGIITSCATAQLNMVNPIFFSYQPPYVYISDFVWSGGSIKPDSALQCTLDSYGNLVNCTPDTSLTSMYFISKEYHNYFYRTHSYPAPATIEKCSNVNSSQCTELINPLLEYPLNLRVTMDHIYITNAVASGEPTILKCSLDMLSCQIITNQIPSPMCIAVFIPHR